MNHSFTARLHSGIWKLSRWQQNHKYSNLCFNKSFLKLILDKSKIIWNFKTIKAAQINVPHLYHTHSEARDGIQFNDTFFIGSNVKYS